MLCQLGVYKGCVTVKHKYHKVVSYTASINIFNIQYFPYIVLFSTENVNHEIKSLKGDGNIEQLVKKGIKLS